MPGLSPTLLGMPHFILENIAGKTDVFARCSLQKCSKHLHSFVPKSPFHFQEIKIFFELNKMALEMTANSETLKVKYCHPFCQETERYLVRDVNYIQRLVADLVAIVGGDKVTVKKLEMEADTINPGYVMGFGNPNTNFYSNKKCFWNFLKQKLGQKTLKVKKLFYFPGYKKKEKDLLEILKILEPGILKTLHFGTMRGLGPDGNRKPTLPLVIETEHWKRASKLRLSGCQVPFEKLSHFKKMLIFNCNVTVADVDCLMQSAIAQRDDFGYYELLGCNLDADIDRYIQEHPYAQGEEDLEIGRLIITGGILNDVEIRIVTAKYIAFLRDGLDNNF